MKCFSSYWSWSNEGKPACNSEWDWNSIIHVPGAAHFSEWQLNEQWLRLIFTAQSLSSGNISLLFIRIFNQTFSLSYPSTTIGFLTIFDSLWPTTNFNSRSTCHRLYSTFNFSRCSLITAYNKRSTASLPHRTSLTTHLPQVPFIEKWQTLLYQNWSVTSTRLLTALTKSKSWLTRKSQRRRREWRAALVMRWSCRLLHLRWILLRCPPLLQHSLPWLRRNLQPQPPRHSLVPPR